MVLASKHQLPQVNHVTTQVDAEPTTILYIKQQMQKNIGTMEMTEPVNMVNQISRLCYFPSKSISKIRTSLAKDAAAQLIHNLNSLLYGVPDYLIDKLHSAFKIVQNTFIFRLQWADHITPAHIIYTSALASCHVPHVMYRI